MPRDEPRKERKMCDDVQHFERSAVRLTLSPVPCPLCLLLGRTVTQQTGRRTQCPPCCCISPHSTLCLPSVQPDFGSSLPAKLSRSHLPQQKLANEPESLCILKFLLKIHHTDVWRWNGSESLFCEITVYLRRPCTITFLSTATSPRFGSHL